MTATITSTTTTVATDDAVGPARLPPCRGDRADPALRGCRLDLALRLALPLVMRGPLVVPVESLLVVLRSSAQRVGGTATARG